MFYDVPMKRDEVKAVVERVLHWPAEDQEGLVRFVDEIEQRHNGDDLSDEDGISLQCEQSGETLRLMRRLRRSSIAIAVHEAALSARLRVLGIAIERS